MKRIIQIEIETLDGYEYLSSTETVKEILTNGYNLSYGFRSQNKTILSVSEIKPKQLISNVLPLKMVTLHHTEDKGFHLVEEQIKNEKFPLRLQGIAWERAYESQDDTLREQG